MRKQKLKAYHFICPTDSVIADKFDKDANAKECDINKIPDAWMGLDIGPESAATFSEVIRNSRTVLWNGPMGVFEFPKFEGGTKSVAFAVVEATKIGAFSLIGGGDSAAAINKFDLANNVSYVSTGGGALLEYFEGKELPGVKMILDSQNK